MTEKNCDILVVGSGLTGIVAAYALSLLGLKIIIIEKKKYLFKNAVLSKNMKEDTRTTAIAEGSKEFLEEIKLWRGLSKLAEPIKKIKVIDRKPINIIDFTNQKKFKNLGYIVKNNNFFLNVLNRLKKQKNIIIFDNTSIKKIDYSQNKIFCQCSNFKIKAKLLLACDGKNSAVRSMAQTPLYKKNYNENALVVNFEHTINHNNCAYEFFYRNGPLAILPMQKQTNFQSSLIWSNSKYFLKNLVLADENVFKNILEEKISKYVGNVVNIKSKQIFPLSAHINYKFYENRLVYVGDSAHSVHPIAGQGWNLGLRDIKKIYFLIKEFQALGLEIGTKQFCKSYNQKTYYDSYRLFQITDKLNSFFMLDNKITSIIRNIGFGIIQKKPNLKKQISNFAMGL